jgi:D-threo-aldose 1-dehydrogenase
MTSLLGTNDRRELMNCSMTVRSVDGQRATLGYGTAPIASVEFDDAIAAIERAYTLGIRTFDTAPRYGHGGAEARLGAGLAEFDRSTFAVSTKVGWLIPTSTHGEVAENAGPSPAFSGDEVERSLEGSLRRLGLDRVDVAFIHDPEDHIAQAIAESAPALVRLREQGMVGAIGVGTTRVEAAIELVAKCDLDCCLIAGRYSLLDQQAATTLLPLCQSRGIETIIGGVFNSGILATPDLEGPFDYVEASGAVRRRAKAIASIAESYDTPIAAVALQYPARDSAVSCVLAGMKSRDEVEANVALFRTKLPEELWQELARDGLVAELTRPLIRDNGRETNPC